MWAAVKGVYDAWPPDDESRLIHELTHQHQYQHGKRRTGFNTEQQADIVRDHYTRIQHSDHNLPPPSAGVYDSYVEDLEAGRIQC